MNRICWIWRLRCALGCNPTFTPLHLPNLGMVNVTKTGPSDSQGWSVPKHTVAAVESYSLGSLRCKAAWQMHRWNTVKPSTGKNCNLFQNAGKKSKWTTSEFWRSYSSTSSNASTTTWFSQVLVLIAEVQSNMNLNHKTCDVSQSPSSIVLQNSQSCWVEIFRSAGLLIVKQLRGNGRPLAALRSWTPSAALRCRKIKPRKDQGKIT